MKNSRIKSKWEVKYLNTGVVQKLNLITDEDFTNIVKPMSKISYELELENKGKPTIESLAIKDLLKNMFGDSSTYFTETSPLGLSIKTRILVLPLVQGGEHKVIWKKV